MVAKKKPQTKKPVQKKKEATKVKENKQMTRTEYVDTITEMCERLNESGLLDELNMIELEDDLTAEQLTDLFCDGVEFVDSKEKSGELDEDIVSFYENEPWKELPDEDEEESELEEDGTETEEECECVCETDDNTEPDEEVVEEEPKPVTKKTSKKKVVVKITKGGKQTVKKSQKPAGGPKKKTINKDTKNKIEKVGVIQTIFDLIKSSKKGLTKKQIVSSLSKAFPDRSAESMAKTVNCQIGGKKRPLRLEASRGIKLLVKDGVFSLKG